MEEYNEISKSEQLAFDMQMAYDLHSKEVAEERQRNLVVARRRLNNNNTKRNTTETDGFCPGNFHTDRMLYVPCEVEGKLVKMLVDSGASSSAISRGEMTRLNLQNKLNERFAGTAVGCGSAKIVGVVENVVVSIGHAEFRLFFLVLETEHPLLILGLDQMRKFKCLIDLEENKLVFGGKGGVEVQFLPFDEDEQNNGINSDLLQQLRRNGCSIM